MFILWPTLVSRTKSLINLQNAGFPVVTTISLYVMYIYPKIHKEIPESNNNSKHLVSLDFTRFLRHERLKYKNKI